MKATRILLLFGIAAVASATSVTFSFGTQNGVTGLAPGATNSQIQTYMDNVLAAVGCTGCTVTITGGGTGANTVYADQTWNADGHVVGPGSGGTSLTLGNSNGATSNSSTTVNGSYDTFLSNLSDGAVTGANQITMKFSGFTINGSASFDYEIFPDVSCPILNAANCGGTGDPNQPDLKFEAGTNSTGTDPLVNSFGTSGIQLGLTPGSGDGTDTHSPLSGSGSAEQAPQYIGYWSGSLSSVNELDFVDWPSAIGVDNLTISWGSSSPVPDPSSILLLGTVVGGIALRKKLRKSA